MNSMNTQLLSLAIWLPILGALPVFWIGSERRTLVRWLSLAVAVAGFLVTIPLYTGFDPARAGMQANKYTTAIKQVARLMIRYPPRGTRGPFPDLRRIRRPS